MYQLIALLDKPSTESFGMVPLLVRKDGDERLYVYRGAKDAPPTTHSDSEFRSMTGHMRVLEDRNIRFEEEPVGKVAGWLGSNFLANCLRLELAPPFPKGCMTVPTDPAEPKMIDGLFWIEPSADAHARLERWLLAAAPLAIRRKDKEIAVLMRWCLPTRVETRAALWYTADDQDAELSWSFRITRPRERGETQETLKRRFEEVVARHLDGT